MASAGSDCVVTTLVEILGGPAKWEKVEQHLHGLGWSYWKPTPKERRIARRAFHADPEDSSFLWVDVPIAGSPWRADREASWQVAAVCKATQVIVYDRLLWREEADRTLQPEWQVYSTRFRAWANPPAQARTWSKPLWWLRKALYQAAIRTGLFDGGPRIHGGKTAVLHLARGMAAPTEREDIDVRPLDGRSRVGVVMHGEDALNRALALIMGPLFAMGLLLVLARQAGPVGVAVCWLLALACASIAWWTALTLPWSRTPLRSALFSLLATALMACVALGVPGVHKGMAPTQAVAMAAVTYYVAGLVLLGRRWRWQVLVASVLPLIATVVVAALPLTGRFLHDMYADELSLNTPETGVSGIWQLAASVKLLWPSLGAILFIAAGWGILRYFHFIRPRSITAGVAAITALTLALTMTVSAALNSPKTASDKLKQAAIQGTAPPPYFGISPEWTCVIPTVPASELTEKGGTLRATEPYISFGIADGQVVLWNRTSEKPLRMAADQIRTTPQQTGTRGCPSRRSAPAHAREVR
ncbi:hypothetical protein [Streptomyces sp. cg2]|uniref:hypothetical protein n=1 Tax=Streptomyces sp. cg2 TaxID=3238799 RepID=UPI0034E24BCF